MAPSPSLEKVAAALRLHLGARICHEGPLVQEKARPRRLDGRGVLRVQVLDQIVDPNELVQDVTIIGALLWFLLCDDVEGEAREVEPPLVDRRRQPRQEFITLRAELQLLRRPAGIAQKELDSNQDLDGVIHPADDVVVAMVPKRLDADPALM